MKTKTNNMQKNTKRQLKQLFVAFTLLCTPAVTWAQYESLPASDYDLWVKGIAVTDNNKDNILSDNNLPTVSYDSESNVLTLSNATIDIASIYEGGIISGRSELTISLLGDNTISCNDSCTAIIAIAEGEQALTIAKGGEHCSLTLDTYRAIRDFNTVNFTGLYWNDDAYTYTYDTTLSGFAPGYRLMRADNEEASKTVDPETFEVQTAPTLTDEKLYDLWIADVQVSNHNATDILGDGTVSFDVATNTLTLNNAVIVPEGESPGITYYGGQDLTIMLIGTSIVQGNWGCEAIRVDNQEPSLIFTTDENVPGKLMCNGEGPLLEEGLQNVVYQNGLGLSTTAEGQMIGHFSRYSLWVMGIRVTSVNKENILGDGTVRFNPANNTLSLYGATLGDTQGTDSLITSALPSLTVELHGNNILKFSVVGFHSRNTSSMTPLTFTTDDYKPGQLSWVTNGGTLYDTFEATYTHPLALQQTGNLISATEAASYGLMVGTTAVTSVNCTDILGNGQGDVTYVPESQTLVLCNAYLSEPIMSSLEGGLTIYLLGENFISGTENLITSTIADAPLAFTSSETLPGKLTMSKSSDEGDWLTGFATPTVPADYATTTDGNVMTIARPVPITPILTETANGETPKVEKAMADFGYEAWGKDPDTYLNVVIDNVLYTLKAGDYNDGNWDDADDPAGVNLTEVPADMNAVLASTPGSDAYAEVFKGLTIEVPAGNGQVMVNGEIGNNAQLGVKIGDNAPVIFPNEDYPDYNKLETIYIPYSCTKPTFVYIYLAGIGTPTSSRAESPFRGRVLSGHIKIKSTGGSSSMIVSNNAYSAQANTFSDRVILYTVPPSAKSADNRGIVLSTVLLDSETAPSRGMRRTTTEERKITELGNAAFDSLDKDDILYIDLSGTEVADMTVNCSAGLFAGFGQNTLFYLPANNDDGGEDNVILNDNCQHLNLSNETDFRAHKDFTAASASIDCHFEVQKTTAVILPFALTKEQAAAVGTFHTLKEIKDDNAVLNEAETNGTAANTPYIFLPSVTKIEAENVSVEGIADGEPGETNPSIVKKGNMAGTYERQTVETGNTDIYCLSAYSPDETVAGEFIRMEAGAAITPFSAYIQAEDCTATALTIIVGDNNTTQLMPVVSRTSAHTSRHWYTISGLRLTGRPSRQGLYINNGKVTYVR